MGDLEHALSAYENALRHNPTSLSGLSQVAGIARIKENYPKVSFFSLNDYIFVVPRLSAGTCLVLFIQSMTYLLFPFRPSSTSSVRSE